MPERHRRGGRRAAGAVLAGLALALVLAVGGPGAAGGPAGAVVGGAPARQAGDDLQLPVDPDRDPDQTRRRAEEILRGDEYRAPEAQDRSVIDRVREWIGDRVPDLGGTTTGAGADIVAYVVFGVVVAGGLAGLAYVVVRAQGTRRAPD
ncbi:MAG TPA: hypothetical protein VGO60_14020, partial [Iamia sp.]|nr:hypothetical protein [Iamia sp.]